MNKSPLWHSFYGSIFLIILFMILSFIDIVREFRSGESPGHLFFEVIVCVSAFIWSLYLWRNWMKTKGQLDLSLQENVELNKENLKWKEENSKLITGLSTSIQEQFHIWRLTPAESEVALLLLRGLSFKEIANLRSSSEKTVRQHALMVYQKSSLPGRAELSAFFLEDLFVSR